MEDIYLLEGKVAERKFKIEIFCLQQEVKRKKTLIRFSS